MVTFTPEYIREEIAKVTWYHRIDLGHGIVTPGSDDTLNRMAMIGLSQRSLWLDCARHRCMGWSILF